MQLTAPTCHKERNWDKSKVKSKNTNFHRNGLHFLHHLCGSLLDLHQYICVPWTGEPRTRPSTPDVSHQCWAERNDHLPMLVPMTGCQCSVSPFLQSVKVSSSWCQKSEVSRLGHCGSLPFPSQTSSDSPCVSFSTAGCSGSCICRVVGKIWTTSFSSSLLLRSLLFSRSSFLGEKKGPPPAHTSCRQWAHLPPKPQPQQEALANS